VFLIRKIRIGKHERGLCFRDREFREVLEPGVHWMLDPLGRLRVDVVSVRDPWIRHRDLDVILASGALGDEVLELDLAQHERALVWVDGRFEAVLGPGRYALFTVFRDVRIERFDAREVRFAGADLFAILNGEGARDAFVSAVVEAGHVGLCSLDGELQAVLAPGTHAFWKGVGVVHVDHVDLREAVLDVSGQEIMTADKVTLRLNAVVVFKVIDPKRAVREVADHRQALYRDAQLTVREVIGTRELDALLSGKDAVAGELERLLRGRAAAYGIEVVNLGIRDVILPGEMKVLLNRVTEAKKAAEAALITRREETAAMRSQANTARILESNPTLMRLRELEVLEKVAERSDLKVVLGEKGLADRIANLL